MDGRSLLLYSHYYCFFARAGICATGVFFAAQRAADFTSHHIHTLAKTDGLAPTYISLPTGKFRAGAALSVGAGADSYYEYLLKQWIQTGKTRQWL